MQRHLTLALLLLSSTNLYAQETLNPEAHKSFVLSSNGKPVLSGNGNCVRNGSYITNGAPNCFLETPTNTQPAPETPKAQAAPTPATDTIEIDNTAMVSIKPVVEAEPGTTTIPTTATQVATSPETSQAEPSNKAAKPVAQVEPVVEVQAEAKTYSFVKAAIATHIYFDFDKNNLRIAEQEKLELAIIEAMQANKLFKVNVEGHADSRGTDAYNYDLSQRRINTVVNYLNLRGIKTDSTMAWGESQLILNADGSENFDHSRRAEVIFKIQKKIAN